MNINIIITSLQVGVKASVVLNDDGTYTILVNKHLTKNKMIQAIIHELTHIENNDWSKEQKATIIEKLVDRSFNIDHFNNYNFFLNII